MGDLTRTFGGLIILAHRVNSQSLYVIASIHIYTRYEASQQIATFEGIIPSKVATRVINNNINIYDIMGDVIFNK
jgi:hypothetical protein